MSASKSHQQTVSAIFGQRVRELREMRQMTQSKLATAVGIDRTTLNKIEAGVRADVSIKRLFAFAEALTTSPVYLLTPRLEDASVELTDGGRVVPAAEARRWIRGESPTDSTPAVWLAWFLSLPRDEQLATVTKRAAEGLGPLNAALMVEEIAADVSETMNALDELSERLRKRGAQPRKIRSKEETNG